MLTLSLLRHAKSSWDEPGLDDYARPLAPRGTKAASEIGKYLRGEQLRPDLVLCSGAVRTRATLTLVLAGLGFPPPEIRYDDALYLGTSAALLEAIRKVDPSFAHVLVIGHNPGLHALTLELIGQGARKEIAAIATKFPTSALAVLTFDAPLWAEVAAATGTLERYVTAKSLA
jgi:phosphohistidine phosphatase